MSANAPTDICFSFKGLKERGGHLAGLPGCRILMWILILAVKPHPMMWSLLLLSGH
ncbi:class II glutamine amidotransferase [Rheinheimera sp. EpRS3]|uniref:class II glutamine amidotransferase n=1 Tax=Rheinheimera sp. EpRS3 TaxID=1712383 RepID=UPI001E2952A9|nr:class II glutamine amidotransferase [Rheinheimera sp. EpRS3]